MMSASASTYYIQRAGTRTAGHHCRSHCAVPSDPPQYYSAVNRKLSRGGHSAFENADRSRPPFLFAGSAVGSGDLPCKLRSDIAPIRTIPPVLERIPIGSNRDAL